jgi:hypothetical protein
MKVSHRSLKARILKEYTGVQKAANETLRQKKLKLLQKKDEILKSQIEPLDAALKQISQELYQKCEHPISHTIVEITPWTSDDGEGNYWSGDDIKLTCKSCGTVHNLHTSDDYNVFNNGTKLGPVDVKNIYEDLYDKEETKRQKERQKLEEQYERKEYLKLKEKYG